MAHSEPYSCRRSPTHAVTRRTERKPTGQILANILHDPKNIGAMIALSEHANIPAVQAIGKQVVKAIGPIDYDTRKAIGRWIAEILSKEGWVPARRGRVKEGFGFTRGMVYRR